MSPTPSASPTPGDRADRPDPSGQVDHPGHDHSVASDCDEAIAELRAELSAELRAESRARPLQSAQT